MKAPTLNLDLGDALIGAGILAGVAALAYAYRGGSNAVGNAQDNVANAWNWIINPVDLWRYMSSDDAELTLGSQQSIALLKDEYGPNAMDALTPGGVWDEEVANTYRAFLRTQQYGASGGW